MVQHLSRNLHNRVFCPYLRAAWRLLSKKTRFLTTGASRTKQSTVNRQQSTVNRQPSTVNSVQTAAKRDRISVSVYCGVQPSLVVK